MINKYGDDNSYPTRFSPAEESIGLCEPAPQKPDTILDICRRIDELANKCNAAALYIDDCICTRPSSEEKNCRNGDMSVMSKLYLVEQKLATVYNTLHKTAETLGERKNEREN